MEKVAAVLIAAHAFADFGLHPKWLVARKKRPGCLAGRICFIGTLLSFSLAVALGS